MGIQSSSLPTRDKQTVRQPKFKELHGQYKIAKNKCRGGVANSWVKVLITWRHWKPVMRCFCFLKKIKWQKNNKRNYCKNHNTAQNLPYQQHFDTERNPNITSPNITALQKWCCPITSLNTTALRSTSCGGGYRCRGQEWGWLWAGRIQLDDVKSRQNSCSSFGLALGYLWTGFWLISGWLLGWFRAGYGLDNDFFIFEYEDEDSWL